MTVAFPVWGRVGILVVPGLSTAIMRVENTFIMIPDHGASSSGGKTGRDDGPIRQKDAGAILEPFERRQVNFFSVMNNIVAFVPVRKLTFLL